MSLHLGARLAPAQAHSEGKGSRGLGDLYQGPVTEAEDKVWLVLPGSRLGQAVGRLAGWGPGGLPSTAFISPRGTGTRLSQNYAEGRGPAGHQACRRWQETPTETEGAREEPQGDAHKEGSPESSSYYLNFLEEKMEV